MRCAFSWATRPATANRCGLHAGNPHAGNLAGGDIACVVVAPHAIRLLLGDVMGHDKRAARTAAEVTRAFQQFAVRPDPLQVVAVRLHAFVADYADREGADREGANGEEFVTAQFVSVPSGGADDAQIVCCGHPPPLLLRDGQATLLDGLSPSPPLGLLGLGGQEPRANLLGARPGDSVLLYTDGVSEARDDCGHPYPLAERAVVLSAQAQEASHCAADGDILPDLMRDDLLTHVSGELRDDATLFYLRFTEALDNVRQDHDAQVSWYAERLAEEAAGVQTVRY